MAYEAPRYQVLSRYDDFEVRRYAPYLVAEVEVRGGFTDVGGEAFRILAGYIQGKNRGKVDMAMTAPVSQSPAERSGEKIAMTAPVTQTPREVGERTWVFTFVMPSSYTLETLPRPLDSRVRLRRVEGRLVAAKRYSGTWSEERYRSHEDALMKAIRSAGLRPVGAPTFARYDPPFTPWFMRRNEVLVEIREEDVARTPAGGAPAARP